MEAPARLRQFSGGSIPDLLKGMRRWAPWHAQFNAKRGKWDKIPRRADRPEIGLSTAAPEKWFTFAAAIEAQRRHPEILNGIGLVMTGISGLIGIDLDGCVNDDGTPAAWAQAIVDAADSYTEVSPSGRGLRIFLRGEMDGSDWDNHTVGIEVYGGSSARFLTVSGSRLTGAPEDIRAVNKEFLPALRGRYGGRTREEANGPVEPMPELLMDDGVPDARSLDLPPAVRDFLLTGEQEGDRSRALQSAGVALYSAGLTDQQVLSVLAHSEYAMEVALDHRRQDHDRALEYLWLHHCVKAKPKARQMVASAEDFEMQIGEGSAPRKDMGGVTKAPRFDIKTASEYANDPRTLEWFIRGVLSKAEMNVIFGASGSGKTFCALDMICRISLGLPWFDIPTRQSRVLYVAAEGAMGVRNRLKAWCAHHQMDVSALDGKLYMLGGQPNFMDKEDVVALVQSMKTICGKIDMLVLDTMAQVTPGANENSGEDMGRFLANCKRLGAALGCTVTAIAHTGKDADKGVRGWSGIKAALDSECEVVRTREYRAITVTKLKDGEGEGREYRFALEGVPLDFDREGGLVTSCVVAPGEVLDIDAASAAADDRRQRGKSKGKPDGSDRKLNERQRVVMDYIRREASTRGRELDENTLLSGLAAALSADDRDGVGIPLKVVQDGKTSWWLRERALRSLESRGFIQITNGKILHIEGQISF